MFFVGVISEEYEFKILKENINKNKNDITLININNKNIQNFRNVKFDTVILMNYTEEQKDKEHYFEEICKNIKYLIINSDIKLKNNILSKIKCNIITCGGNHRSTVTFSSISEDAMLISVQRNFKNKNNKEIEVGEYNYKIESNMNIYEVLIEFIIRKIYCI